MRPKSFMVIAGEASGDLLAAELVAELRRLVSDASAAPTPDYQPLRASLEPRFFGAGGSRMQAAGVEVVVDPTKDSVTGISDVLIRLLSFRRMFRQLYSLALAREPDVIICVDFSEFNRRFAQAIRRHVRSRTGWFQDWQPKIVRYVSPQVWASRENRVYGIARDHDLVLALFAFEPEWYARRVPALHVEFVGHPILDRHLREEAETEPDPFSHLNLPNGVQSQGLEIQPSSILHPPSSPRVLLLPGSRQDELRRHLPVMLEALKLLAESLPNLTSRLVLPDDELAKTAQAMGLPAGLQPQVGGLAPALRHADLALASTGTVTLECACWGVPTVALYKTSWATFAIARRLATVKYIAMPNLLAGEEVFPEFIQDAATPQNLARAAFELVRDDRRRSHVKSKLADVVRQLGPPGASRRAAQAVLQVLDPLYAASSRP